MSQGRQPIESKKEQILHDDRSLGDFGGGK